MSTKIIPENMDERDTDRVVTEVQQAIDPNGLGVQFDWDFIEPLYVNAWHSIEAAIDTGAISPEVEIDKQSAERVIKACRTIFYGI